MDEMTATTTTADTVPEAEGASFMLVRQEEDDYDTEIKGFTVLAPTSGHHNNAHQNDKDEKIAGRPIGLPSKRHNSNVVSEQEVETKPITIKDKVVPISAPAHSRTSPAGHGHGYRATPDSFSMGDTGNQGYYSHVVPSSPYLPGARGSQYISTGHSSGYRSSHIGPQYPHPQMQHQPRHYGNVHQSPRYGSARSQESPQPPPQQTLIHQVNAGRRPTLDNLDPNEKTQVNTPEELLEHCCQFPACYDPLYELCIDTCRKCETDFPVTSWLPCPSLLNIPDCTSDGLSRLGRLPLACYPDIGPFANIVPVSTVVRSALYQDQSGLLPSLVMGRDGSGGVGGSVASASDREQAYRSSMQKKNKKTCSARGLCHSDTEGKTRIFGRRRKND